jgi:hypothetical protein
MSLGKTELTLSPDQVELAYRKVPTLPERVSTNVRRSGLASRQASWLVLAINWVCEDGPDGFSTVVHIECSERILGHRATHICTCVRVCQC